MALITAGTNTTSALVGVRWPASIADVAAINALIRDDLTVGTPLASRSGIGGLVSEGKLFIPNRGSLVLYEGDVVAVDDTGGVVLITKRGDLGTDWVTA